MRVARAGARVVLVGIPSDDRTSFGAVARAPQGPDHRDGAADERGLPARDPARRPRASSTSTGSPPHRYPARAQVGEAFAVAAARTGLKVMVEP